MQHARTRPPRCIGGRTLVGGFLFLSFQKKKKKPLLFQRGYAKVRRVVNLAQGASESFSYVCTDTVLFRWEEDLSRPRAWCLPAWDAAWRAGPGPESCMFLAGLARDPCSFLISVDFFPCATLCKSFCATIHKATQPNSCRRPPGSDWANLAGALGANNEFWC